MPVKNCCVQFTFLGEKIGCKCGSLFIILVVQFTVFFAGEYEQQKREEVHRKHGVHPEKDCSSRHPLIFFLQSKNWGQKKGSLDSIAQSIPCRSGFFMPYT